MAVAIDSLRYELIAFETFFDENKDQERHARPLHDVELDQGFDRAYELLPSATRMGGVRRRSRRLFFNRVPFDRPQRVSTALRATSIAERLDPAGVVDLSEADWTRLLHFNRQGARLPSMVV
jgi:hypothetical protein